MPDLVIYSDLDGTLLDAEDYSYAAAQPALQMVRTRGIPLVLCSSKTRAEIEVYRGRMGNEHPFIAENGGGIFIPQGYFTKPFDLPAQVEAVDGYHLVRLAAPYAEIRRRFAALRDQTGIKVRGFADMSDEEVAALTGLPVMEAALARHRDFEEPFVFEGAPAPAFLEAIEADGLRWTQGRLFHIMGNHDKGRAVQLLQSLFRREYGGAASVGLGDSLNDLPMLQAVDRPVLVRHPDGGYDERVKLPQLLRTQRPGPSGWSDAVLRLLVPPHPPDATREALSGIFEAALAAADPYRAVLDAVRVQGGRLLVRGVSYDLAAYDRILVVGAGKATARMAQAVEKLLGSRITQGLVIVKYGHKAPLRLVEQVEAAHPVPDEAGVNGTKRILDLLETADDRTLAICLFSGGASALLVAPVEGILLQDKQQVTEMLLDAGAAIGELNAVRKHLSAVKGGRLAQAAWPAQVVTLLLSDVIGDRIDVIASGPTAPDKSSFADAWAVIHNHGLPEKLPARVRDYLRRGLVGKEIETVKEGDPCLDRTQNAIVGGIVSALAAAAEKAREFHFATEIVDAELQGEARVVAQQLAQQARARLAGMSAGERRCLLWGGETTVTVRGNGKGGRNQELALAFALSIEDADVAMLSAGTDGSDGPTDAAGAMVDGATAAEARRIGLDAAAYLDDNDSYTYFHRLDELTGWHSHFRTGPTGTNVMDLQVVLCGGER
jgi:hydroxypyruvate reductase